MISIRSSKSVKVLFKKFIPDHLKTQNICSALKRCPFMLKFCLDRYKTLNAYFHWY